jgi:UDPglucose 6-dehydrogenase
MRVSVVGCGYLGAVHAVAMTELGHEVVGAFLATSISFINAMPELCEATGADVLQLADAIGYDDRIGRKFIRAFMARADELGADQALTAAPSASWPQG